MNSTEYAFTAPVIAAGVTALLLVILLRFPGFLADLPNQRSLHVYPVPRTGGVAVVLGAFGTTAALLPDYLLLISCALLVAIVSLVDDWRRLDPLPRFGAQALIAAAFIGYGLDQISIAESVFLLLAIVWLANLYNFMDGSDGLAGGMAVIGFGTCSLGAWIGGGGVLATLCLSIVAATLPFLALNFHPAKIFMGDVGAVTLGFAAAVIGAVGWREGVWSPFFPVFVFSPFIADASLTLLHRILSKERFWKPHRDHYYQKLVRMGLGHRNTALAEYAVMGISGGGAIATLYMEGTAQLAAIVAWGAVLMVIAHCIDRRWVMQQRQI